MLRLVAGRIGSSARNVISPKTTSAVHITRAAHDVQETDEEFDTRYENYFNRPDIDHWEIRKAMNTLAGM